MPPSPSNSPGGPALVCFALEGEARPFRRLVGARTDVRILVTGMGQANARRGASEAVAELGPAQVLTCGLAGALDPELAHGAVLFDADPAFPRADRWRAIGARQARFHCVERIVAAAVEKGRLRQSTRADAVEMESAPIRALCRAAGVPGATVRVISDVAGEDLPLDFNRFLTPALDLDYRRLLWAVACRPRLISGLLRLQRHTRLATARLADALAALLAP